MMMKLKSGSSKAKKRTWNRNQNLNQNHLRRDNMEYLQETWDFVANMNLSWPTKPVNIQKQRSGTKEKEITLPKKYCTDQTLKTSVEWKVKRASTCRSTKPICETWKVKQRALMHGSVGFGCDLTRGREIILFFIKLY